MGLEPQRATGRSPGPLRIWAVSDGRAGIENQALGLAEAVAAITPADIAIKRLRWRAWLRRLPTRLAPAMPALLAAGSDPLAPPWPDLWIGAGRASVPASIRIRRWSRGATFVVQLQDPQRSPRLFDLVIPPHHDQLEGERVFPILGAPHRVTPGRLMAQSALFSERLAGLPHPIVALLVGGRSHAFDLGPARAHALGEEIAGAVRRAGGSLLATFSRRTPTTARIAMTAALDRTPGWIWDGEGANPYFAFLGAADVVVVTADSITMAAEAAAAGKPVLIAAVEGSQARKDRFHAELAARGVARPFAGDVTPWPCAPLRETERAAAEVLRRLRTRSVGPCADA